MREHMGLFRGKRCDNGEWVEGFYAHFKDLYKDKETHRIYTPFAESDCGEFYPDWYEVDPDTVGECTGLKDKNGKLIFEGDVTKDDWYREWEIIGCPGGFAARRPAEEWTLIGPAAGLSDAQNARWLEDTHVIIGNIHDNKNLLSGQEVEK